MLVRLVALIALMLTLACGACGASLPETRSPDVIPYTDAAVLLETECQDETTGEWELKSWGSGIQTDESNVVTAWHVVDDVPENCRVLAKRGTWVSLVHVVQKDEARDLAWLYAPGLPPRSVPIRIRTPLLGERVVCVGYSFIPNREERFLSVTRGEIATIGVDGDMYRFTAPVLFGHSGGGCFGEDGALLLIVQRGWFSPHGGPFHGYYFGRTPL